MNTYRYTVIISEKWQKMNILGKKIIEWTLIREYTTKREKFYKRSRSRKTDDYTRYGKKMPGSTGRCCKKDTCI